MESNNPLDGHPIATTIFERVCSCLAELGPFEVRTSKSQIAFWRQHGFAYLWRPGQYLRNASAEAVLSIVLGRHDPSARFKEVVHPSTRHWVHHLELNAPAEIDDEVREWLREAMTHAS